MLGSALRWWHTLRHLRPVQIYGRLWFRLFRPRIDCAPAPPLRPAARPFAARAWHAVSLIETDTFRFLNETHGLPEMGGWDAPTVSKLWRYNLHYFDDLRASGAEERKAWHLALLTRWVKENPPGKGTGWEPYPTSLRLVNWLAWHWAGNALPAECLQSVAIQARWLSRRLERHLLGNHLWANAKALVFAGASFTGAEAERWLQRGVQLLQRELREQVLPDGGHFERSPMYHAIVLADLLDLLDLAEVFPEVFSESVVAEWRKSAGRMLGWLAAMTHPDGGIALFNDAAFGVAPRLAEIGLHAQSLGIETALYADHASVDLADSGYVRMTAGHAVVIADVGPVGPDYIPGHAHADTLSFEMSLFGQRVIVDSGTSRYDDTPERLYQRGTAAHNTVEIDAKNSSEVWASFRVAQRARPFERKLEQAGSVLTLECAHDGYRRLPGKPVHRRRWRLSPNVLVIEDRIDGGFHTAVARYHFHPGIRVEMKGEQQGCVILPGGQSLLWQVKGARCHLTTSSYHSEFNVSLMRPCLELMIEQQGCEMTLDWSNCS